MKTKTILAAFLVLVLAGLSSCKKDDYIQNRMEHGEWEITRFTDGGDDETHKFGGYNFTFDNDGAVIASGKSVTVTGTWSVVSSTEEDKFILNFGQVDPFDELNEDWHIIECERKELRLKHSNSDTDLLTFERI